MSDVFQTLFQSCVWSYFSQPALWGIILFLISHCFLCLKETEKKRSLGEKSMNPVIQKISTTLLFTSQPKSFWKRFIEIRFWSRYQTALLKIITLGWVHAINPKLYMVSFRWIFQHIRIWTAMFNLYPQAKTVFFYLARHDNLGKIWTWFMINVMSAFALYALKSFPFGERFNTVSSMLHSHRQTKWRFTLHRCLSLFHCN